MNALGGSTRSRIFICYRREDSDHAVGRLADDLRRHFADERVFQDVANIEPGADFGDALQRGLDTCAAVLIVIGPSWLTVTDRNGRRRLDSSADWVRKEVEESLRSASVRVFPVLVGDVEMPDAEDLPESLLGLTRRQAFPLTTRHWPKDVLQLISHLKKVPGLHDATDNGTAAHGLPDQAHAKAGHQLNPAAESAEAPAPSTALSARSAQWRRHRLAKFGASVSLLMLILWGGWQWSGYSKDQHASPGVEGIRPREDAGGRAVDTQRKDAGRPAVDTKDVAMQAEDTRRKNAALRAEDMRVKDAARRAEDTRLKEAVQRAEDARVKEAARRAEEMRLEMAARQAEDIRLREDAARQAEETRLKEDATRRAEDTRLKQEAARQAEDTRLKEAARRAEETRAKDAAAKRPQSSSRPYY